MSLIDILSLIKSGGLVCVCLVILYLGSRGQWVFGRTYKDCRKELKEWKRLALTSTQVAEQVLAVRKSDAQDD